MNVSFPLFSFLETDQNVSLDREIVLCWSIDQIEVYFIVPIRDLNKYESDFCSEKEKRIIVSNCK